MLYYLCKFGWRYYYYYYYICIDKCKYVVKISSTLLLFYDCFSCSSFPQRSLTHNFLLFRSLFYECECCFCCMYFFFIPFLFIHIIKFYRLVKCSVLTLDIIGMIVESLALITTNERQREKNTQRIN